MRDSVTHAVEDYLKAIYELSQSEVWVTTNALAERMGVAAASATGMVQKMAASQPPLVVYRKHHGVTLTPPGEQIALEIIRHHRLIELFLQQTLGYSWDEVHAEADLLEHVISEKFEERIAQALGDPAHDPHGEPIPTRDLRLPPRALSRLADLRPPQEAVVRMVENPEPELLRYLSGLCLTPGACITVLEYSPFDENLRLQVDDCVAPVTLGAKITQRVWVEL